MAPSTNKPKAGAGKKAKRKVKAPSNGNLSDPSLTVTRMSSRSTSSPLNPNRALLTQQDIDEADRDESEPEDQSDSDSENGTLQTRGGTRVSQLAMPVQIMTELTAKETERLHTAL